MTFHLNDLSPQYTVPDSRAEYGDILSLAVTDLSPQYTVPDSRAEYGDIFRLAVTDLFTPIYCARQHG